MPTAGGERPCHRAGEDQLTTLIFDELSHPDISETLLAH
jgi:hypothetical protein